MIKNIFSIFFPPRCPFCGKVTSNNVSICENCLPELQYIPDDVCRICGIERNECDCKKRVYHCMRRTAPLYYEGSARRGIVLLKKYGKFGGIETLCDMIANKVNQAYADVDFDCVTFVPIGKRSMRERGYNQTELLAAGVASRLNLPLNKHMLIRLYDSKPQKGMNKSNRLGNVAGVFDVESLEDVMGKTVLIIDDVITTGATINECAKMLKIFGAQRIYAAALCIDKPKYKKSK